MEYQPELGQMIFGQASKEHSAPAIMDAVLEAIDAELCRAMWNIHQKEYVSPFRNTAAEFKEIGTFQVEAYSWDEDYEQPWNFKCGDLEVSWYKYLGRGMSANMEISPQMAADVLEKCVDAIRENERIKTGAEDE